MSAATIRVELPFTPRPWQVPLLDDPAKRIVAVVHRRAGKSDVLMWRGLRKALTLPRHNPAPRVVHTLPLAVQWDRTGLWDRLARAATGIPGAQVRKQERRILLPNGGVYQTGGMDNPDGWRGGYADEFIEDEADDILGGGLETIIEPMLADHAGVRVWSGTPKGNGRLRDRFEKGRLDPAYSTFLLRYDQTGFIGSVSRAKDPDKWAAAVQTLRAEMTEEEFAQEMECSFDAPNSGSYYGKLLTAAEAEGRIGTIPHNPGLPVVTAWDLGVDDATAIWFVQAVPGGFHVIDYLEDSGEGAEHYARLLKAKPYLYDRHHLPHDVAQRDWGSGRSRRDVLESLGVRPLVTGRQAPVADGINAVRMLLPRCRFDARACEAGLKALRGYRREWNDAAGTWRANPLHDWCFAPETKVLTRSGIYQIMDLPETGEVLTPCGWKAYANPRVTRRAAPLVEVQFSDGTMVRCTPDHLFLTDSGWKYASDLRKGSLIQSCLTRSRSILMGASIGFGLARDIGRAAAKSFTAMCGSWRLGRSQKAATSTIATVSRATMLSAIWSASQRASICPSLGKSPNATWTEPSISAKARGKPLLTGTDLKRGGFGTAGTRSVRSRGLSGGVRNVLVRLAAWCSTRWSVKVGTRKGSAPQFAKPLRIAFVRQTSDQADVWCLTVPDGECFALSNGAVVHNCSHGADAFREFAMNAAEWREAARKPAARAEGDYDVCKW